MRAEVLIGVIRVATGGLLTTFRGEAKNRAAMVESARACAFGWQNALPGEPITVREIERKAWGDGWRFVGAAS